MAGVKIKRNRNYAWPVGWTSTDEKGEEQSAGEMTATYRLPTEEEFKKVPQNDKAGLLKLVLKGVKGLEVEDGDNSLTTFKELKPFIIEDAELSKAFYDGFMELWAKKTLPATWQLQARTIMDLLAQNPQAEDIALD